MGKKMECSSYEQYLVLHSTTTAQYVHVLMSGRINLNQALSPARVPHTRLTPRTPPPNPRQEHPWDLLSEFQEFRSKVRTLDRVRPSAPYFMRSFPPFCSCSSSGEWVGCVGWDDATVCDIEQRVLYIAHVQSVRHNMRTVHKNEELCI